jgi:hypothetical protein
VPLSLGGCPGLAVDSFPIRDEGPYCFVDVILEGDPSTADLSQGGYRGLVVTRDQRRGPRGQLAGPFGSQDAQSEMVVHTLETIFDRKSCHFSSLVSLGVFPRPGDCGASARATAKPP